VRRRDAIGNLDRRVIVDDEISDEMRELIAERWPHLLAKLKPPQRQ
jgi:hypothetical protein